jgi:hypothetical protein
MTIIHVVIRQYHGLELNTLRFHSNEIDFKWFRSGYNSYPEVPIAVPSSHSLGFLVLTQ